MNNEIKKRLPLQCPACDAPLKVGRMFVGNAIRRCAVRLNCLYWRN